MLSIRHIVKQYEGQRALDDVSIEIEKGKIFGLLGPNGAGKTSLIRIINQITAPDSGEILFNGEKLNQSHIERIGYLPEERGMYKKMQIGEQIVYLAKLKGMSQSEATNSAKKWFTKLGIESWWNKKIEELSKGMAQKAQFVSTVMHEPDLVILDEPFSGFDPVNAEIIKNEILELNRKGATIIFSTHRMESVEELCDSIALLNKSKKILEGRVRDIRKAYRNNTFMLEYEGNKINVNGNAPFEVLEEQDLGDGHQLRLQLKDGVSANEVLNYVMPQIQIVGFREVIPTMNDIFIEKVNQLS
ncbi:MAG TPA: ATP-binding cassette domain-containing protein [Flavipsychrobacter sp.]|nr:ATP-binding cassette domain-containing protein [Flavipsychrobacter sp.]